MAIQNAAMLVKLTKRRWRGFLHDSTVDENVQQTYKATRQAGNFNKRLIDTHILKPISVAESRIINKHVELTLPWYYDGVSLLPSKLYFQYVGAMQELKDAFWIEVDNFIAQYPVHIANQESRLGGLFHEEDYPAPDVLRTKFSVDWYFTPVPSQDHFIVDLEKDEEDKLRAALTNDMKVAENRILSALVDRISRSVQAIRERMIIPNSIFHKTLFEELGNVTDLIPAMNVTNNKALNEVYKRLKSTMLEADVQLIRKHSAFRRSIADEALKLYTKLQEIKNGAG